MKLKTFTMSVLSIAIVAISSTTLSSEDSLGDTQELIKEISVKGLIEDEIDKCEKERIEDELRKKRKDAEKKRAIARHKKISEESIIAEIITKLQPKVSNKEKTEIAQSVVELSKKYELDPYWMLSIMYTESRFKNNVVSNKGAVGLMQLIPKTAKQFGAKSTEELYNPKINMNVGFKHYKYLLDRYNNPKMATIAYNQGVGNVSRGTYRTWYHNKVNTNYNNIINLKEDIRRDFNETK